MNGKQAKRLRRLARGAATEAPDVITHAKRIEYVDEEKAVKMVGVQMTRAHAPASEEGLYRRLKDRFDLLPERNRIRNPK